MKKITFTLVALACAFCTVAEEVQPVERKQLTPEQKAALNKKVQILKGGEKIAKPGTQRGVITIVNAQQRASREWIAATTDYLKRETKYNIVLKDGEFDAANPVVQGQMTVYVIDNPNLPRSVVAPDDRWAYCNVAKVHSEKPAFFEARTKKSLSRAFAMLCGGMSSSYSISLVGPMPKVGDLDVIPTEQIPVDVTIRMEPYMEKFGVTPATMKPYKIAVEEGWAPAPTNEVQQAIWDQTHTIPKNPMKIEFDPKKGR